MLARLLFLTSFFCIHALTADLETVGNVDLKRYVGTWHEIARFPNKHQTDCIKTTATYEFGKNGEISVKNTCTLANGTSKEVTGLARVEDKVSNAKLKVNFVPTWLRWLGIGWGNYWIIELDDNYKYAVVSEPKREYLWILSRTPQISKNLYDGIIARLSQKGFDISKLIVSGQMK